MTLGEWQPKSEVLVARVCQVATCHWATCHLPLATRRDGCDLTAVASTLVAELKQCIVLFDALFNLLLKHLSPLEKLDFTTEVQNLIVAYEISIFGSQARDLFRYLLGPPFLHVMIILLCLEHHRFVFCENIQRDSQLTGKGSNEFSTLF